MVVVVRKNWFKDIMSFAGQVRSPGNCCMVRQSMARQRLMWGDSPPRRRCQQHCPLCWHIPATRHSLNTSSQRVNSRGNGWFWSDHKQFLTKIVTRSRLTASTMYSFSSVTSFGVYRQETVFERPPEIQLGPKLRVLCLPWKWLLPVVYIVQGHIFFYSGFDPHESRFWEGYSTTVRLCSHLPEGWKKVFLRAYILGDPGEPYIRDLGSAFPRKQDVLTLEVEMNDLMVMQEMETSGNVQSDVFTTAIPLQQLSCRRTRQGSEQIATLPENQSCHHRNTLSPITLFQCLALTQVFQSCPCACKNHQRELSPSHDEFNHVC